MEVGTARERFEDGLRPTRWQTYALRMGTAVLVAATQRLIIKWIGRLL